MLGLYYTLVIIIGVPLYILLGSISFLVCPIFDIGTAIHRKLFRLWPQMPRNLRYSLCGLLTLSAVLMISAVLVGLGVGLYFFLDHKEVSLEQILKIIGGLGVTLVLLMVAVNN